MRETMQAMEEHCVEHIRRILRSSLPLVERSLLESSSDKDASINLSIKFLPIEGHIEVSIGGKTNLPLGIDKAKASLTNGQLHLL